VSRVGVVAKKRYQRWTPVRHSFPSLTMRTNLA
jgi:hypothetical protein